MARRRAVLLHSNRCITAVTDWADQLDWRMLQSVVIDEEALVEVRFTVHLLRVVLVDYSHILRQVARIKHPMNALRGPVKAVAVAFDGVCVVYSLVSHGHVSRVRIALTLLFFHVFFEGAEAMEALLDLHLSTKYEKG